MAFRQGAFERLSKLVRGDLALVQVLLHQCLVCLDHLVDDRRVEIGHVAEVALPRRVGEAVDYRLAPVSRKVDRLADRAESLLEC